MFALILMKEVKDSCLGFLHFMKLLKKGELQYKNDINYTQNKLELYLLKKILHLIKIKFL